RRLHRRRAPFPYTTLFRSVIRESAWYEHRMFKRLAPTSGQLLCNLHAFGPRCAEVARMRLFRDWLCDHADDRELYQSVKLSSAQDRKSTRLNSSHVSISYA